MNRVNQNAGTLEIVKPSELDAVEGILRAFTFSGAECSTNGLRGAMERFRVNRLLIRAEGHPRSTGEDDQLLRPYRVGKRATGALVNATMAAVDHTRSENFVVKTDTLNRPELEVAYEITRIVTEEDHQTDTMPKFPTFSVRQA